MMRGAKLKGVYGKPWSRLVSEDFVLDARVMRRLGQTMVDAVVSEARVDLAKQGRVVGKAMAEGIPHSEAFFRSFGYRLSGRSTIEVTSTWPFIDELLSGRDPYPMTWLTRARGATVVPLFQPDGRVVFRAAPLKLQDAWVHPGFARHTFLRRGIQKGREEMARVVSAEVTRALMEGNPFR